MKELLFKNNKLFTIIVYSIIYLYTFLVSYFVIWKNKVNFCFFEFNIICLYFCATLAFFTIILFDEKRKNKPEKKIFKIKNDSTKAMILLTFCIIVLFAFSLLPQYTPLGFFSIPFLIMSISGIFKIKKHKISEIEINYEENYLYINTEKILFSDIKEYFVIFKDFMHKYEIFLKDERIIHCTTFTEDVRNFEKSLFRNLRYLKINEKN